MPFWGWVLLIAAASALVVASIFVIIHHTHRRMPEREVAEGDATDLSAPLPSYVREEQESMTERELEREHEQDAEREAEQPRALW
jgi:DNA-binding cell septation regulator SpoVG